MGISNLLQLIGGLALFLFGMNTMGTGLEKTSGGKLEKLLERLTSNPIKAVLLGAAVTGVIQSSSATTVMVVGFVNSGIMKLSQAVGVIMGANIGTTVTSWILSLSGIQSDNFFVSLLKPDSFSPIFALVGVVLLLFFQGERNKNIGSIFIGFGVLMFGMDTMSSAVKPLAQTPEFVDILTMFANPILGLIVGALFTAVIQSSSASVGVLQALCMTGTISVGVALPIIMGQNIGTCITAILSSIGANKNAKRAALIHLYFNLIGTVLFMAGFYSLNALMNFGFLNDILNPAGVAVIHTIFNISCTIVLLPFAKLLEKLAYLSLPEKNLDMQAENADDFQLLDARFLDKTSFATEQCRNVTSKMARLTKESMYKALGLLGQFDEDVAAEVLVLEDKVDKFEDQLSTYLVKLSSKNLSEKDSRTISILLHCIGDFERISDHSVNVMQAAKEMHDKKLSFSKEANAEIRTFVEAVKEIIAITFEAFETENTELAQTVEPLEEVIDNLNESLKKRHIKRLRTGTCTIELGFVLSDIINTFERISDHCSNVALWVLHSKEIGFDTHGYVERMRRGDNEYFETKYLQFKGKYVLPKNS